MKKIAKIKKRNQIIKNKMKIVINIEADSVDELNTVLSRLNTGAVPLWAKEAQIVSTPLVVQIKEETAQNVSVSELQKPRTRAPKEKTAEPAPSVAAAPVQSMISHPIADPLANPGTLTVSESNDPLAGTPTPAAAETGVLTLEMIRHKVAKAALNNKQAVKDLIKTYTTADGKPCEITTEIPEKDWADYYTKLDLIGL